MEIILANHRGFCYGVKRAVDMALACADAERRACTLGPIIHNPQMVDRLAAQGVGVVQRLEEVPQGTVIIRSHGVGPAIYNQAREMQLTVVDATCPHVKKAQQAAHRLAQEEYYVVIVGEAAHPEVESILAWAGTDAKVVGTVEEAARLPFHHNVGVVSQTTFSSARFENIVNVLQNKTDNLKIERTICTATDMRQQAAIELAKQVDIMLIVGGKNSANTTRLAELCREAGSVVYHIETAVELQQKWFTKDSVVGITAGASTPDWLIEEVQKKMQDFEMMLNQECTQLETGAIVKGKVVGVRKDEVFVDLGYKAEGVIPAGELAYPAPESASDVVKEGDIIEVYVLDPDSSEGNVKLSKIKADKILAWTKLEEALAAKKPLDVQVTEAVKGGLAVAVLGVRGFIPASQVDIKFTENLTPFVGQTLEAIVIEVDSDKQRVVLSRRALLDELRRQREAEVFAKLAVGQVVKGTVSRLVTFGAFVDLGGVDGLIHISDLSWQRVKTPDEVVSVGDEVEVVVLKLDPQAHKISLSLKQVQRDPWFDAIEHFSEGMTVKGRVTKLASFGAFIEISKGVEGLAHISELAERRIAKPEEVVAIGQELMVKIIQIDRKNKKMGLSVAQAQQDAEKEEYRHYIQEQEHFGTTIGEKLGHLFKRED